MDPERRPAASFSLRTGGREEVKGISAKSLTIRAAGSLVAAYSCQFISPPVRLPSPPGQLWVLIERTCDKIQRGILNKFTSRKEEL